jgi:hypothetical protein
MSIKTEIIEASEKLLEENPDGLRFSVLAKLLKQRLPHIKPGNYPPNLVNLEKNAVGVIYKPAKGWFRLEKYKESPTETASPQLIQVEKHKEEQFYEPFAEWLVDELEDCSKAIALGGAKFKDKWGTPDVIGVLKPKATDIFPFPVEIVSVEIKVNTNDLITAFGQACSYRLFSHRAYIVVPETSPTEDVSRIESLCLIFGMGLIIFNPTDPANPGFKIKTRASSHKPDMFYVNKYLKPIADDLLS